MKLHPVRAELFRAEGQADMTKLSLFEILRPHLTTINLLPLMSLFYCLAST